MLLHRLLLSSSLAVPLRLLLRMPLAASLAAPLAASLAAGIVAVLDSESCLCRFYRDLVPERQKCATIHPIADGVLDATGNSCSLVSPDVA